MSDTLEKLIGVEKTAVTLVADAETEANRRKAQVRLEVQRARAELARQLAETSEKALSEARARVEQDRSRKNEEHRRKLAALSLNRAEFNRLVASYIGKGS